MNSLKIAKTFSSPRKINGNVLQQFYRRSANDCGEPKHHIEKGIYGDTSDIKSKLDCGKSQRPGKSGNKLGSLNNLTASIDASKLRDSMASNLSAKLPKSLPDFASFGSRSGGGGSGNERSPRAMAFPYTFTAKIVQFPLKYYIANQWIWKYYFIALILCLPVFYKISRLANSPANKEKWAEMKRLEHEGHGDDEDDAPASGDGGGHH